MQIDRLKFICSIIKFQWKLYYGVKNKKINMFDLKENLDS